MVKWYTVEEVAGFEIAQNLGSVMGSTIRARHVGKDILAMLRMLVGGELPEYTEMMAESREQAWADVEAGIRRDVHEHFYTIGGPADWLVRQDQRPEDLTPREIAESRRWIIGTPDDAIRALQEPDAECGGIGGVMLTTHEWTSHLKIRNSLDLFARYVMPRFRGHTTDLERSWERTVADRRAVRLPSFGGPPAAGDEPAGSDGHRSNLFVDR